ncbi:MAG: hypothetical protein RLY97_887, partial [Pseudomonadota bacterium]
LIMAAVSVVGCHKTEVKVDRPASAQGFPAADRPVSQIRSNAFSTEARRDSVNEARLVMAMAAIQPGMTVADIGAGEGYYTVRLAPMVGARGRVLAEDIDRAVLVRLGDRVARDRLDNISIIQGDEADPHLPDGSFDRIFLVHMYHEVREPYAFLWHLRPALRKNGRVILVDSDRPSDAHGIPPAQAFCEFAALGFRLTQFVRKPEITGYYAQFELAGGRPSATAIKPCKDTVNNNAKAILP